MTHLRKILQWAIGLLLGAYVILIFALDNTKVQQYIADSATKQIEQVIGSKVSIDHISVGLFNAVELHDVTLYDKKGKTLLSSGLIYGKVRLLPLLHGKIFLRNISILDADIRLYKERAGADPNFKFLIDAFKSDSGKKKPLNLTINSLLLRRCRLAYDDLYIPQGEATKFSPHHIYADNIEANLSLKELTNDSVNLRVRQLKIHERSGLQLDNLRMHLSANRRRAEINDLLVQLPQSHVAQKQLVATYDFKGWKTLKETLAIEGNLTDIVVATADLVPFVPQLAQIDETLSVNSAITHTAGKTTLRNLSIHNATNSLTYVGDVALTMGGAQGTGVNAVISKLSVQQDFTARLFECFAKKSMPKALAALGDIGFTGNATYLQASQGSRKPIDAEALLKGNVSTAAGTLTADATLHDRRLAAKISSADFDPSTLIAGKAIPTFVNFDAEAAARLTEKTTNGKATIGIAPAITDVTLHSVVVNDTKYSNIHALATLDGNDVSLHVDANDVAAKLTADGTARLNASAPFAQLPSNLRLDVSVDQLSPGRLHITKRYGQGIISLHATADIATLNPDDIEGSIDVSDFTLSGDNANLLPYRLKQLRLQAYPVEEGSHVTLKSDFAQLEYNGPLSPARLSDIGNKVYDSIQQGAYSDADTAPAADDDAADHHISFALALKDVEPINRLAGLRLSQRGTIQAQGASTKDGRHFTFSVLAPELGFGTLAFHNLSIYARNNDGAFNLLGKVGKRLTKGDLQAELTAVNRDGRLLTDIEWEETQQHNFYGKITASSDINIPRHTDGGTASADFTFSTDFLPSTLCIGDSLWQFSRSHVEYRDKRVTIENLGIHNDTQSLAINGIYDRSAEDTIVVDLNNVDLAYALAFARIGVVDFAGHATGKAYIRQQQNGNPWAKAVVNVPDFHFNGAPFGNADVTLGWNHELSDITIQGNITEDGIGYTRVRGYVDPINKELDLHTESKNTQLGFLNKYTEGIFSDISGRATGRCRIYGGFRTVEFSGHEIGECQATIPVTGVTYNVSNADVEVLPDTFKIKSATIRDNYHGNGVASGYLAHEHIKNMCYDFSLSGSNLRLYDKPREIDMPFYATAQGSGDVHIFGSPGKMNADMRITTRPGSELTYILDSPDADVSQLLTFHDAAEQAPAASMLVPQPTQPNPEATKSAPATPASTPAAAPTTDINLYFEVDVDDKSCLHLITDDKSGDVITVYGSGPIQATYHNKSGFQMYGTYNIDRGTYGLNIPMLAQRKKFDILSGGKVRFSGDPTSAEVDVKAQYVVNSASLADLNIGSGFGNNTTRVNCLVDIFGEVANMQFNLDFELPNCSEDEQQMVHNLIASDEDRTMQVLYLLGVGRFYAYNYTSNDIGQSQSVLMMNSLLSSTLSSQLNNIIANAVGSSNWTFGTNISTGQLGWSDMEVEGLISSRLLNNRLLLNGNFGYSERQYTTTNFVGDFDVQYLITPKGTVSVKAYSETNDRYFTKSNLTTQGVGLQLKHDFTKFLNLFRRKKTQQQ